MLATAVAGITLATGACSAHEAEPQPTFEYPTTAVPIEPSDPLSPGQATRELINADAPVHITFVPTVKSSDTTTTEKEIVPGYNNSIQHELNKYAMRLVASDATIIEDFTDDFARATDGRFRPSSVTVDAITEPLNLGGRCIDSKDMGQVERIQSAALPLREAGALNMIVLDMTGCEDTGGYNGPDGDPVIPIDSIPNLGSVAAHEFGHGANLGHAGEEVCADPITIESCTTNPTGDKGSVMSYQRDAEVVASININNGQISMTENEDSSQYALRYSAPEMQFIGLLEESESVVNPQDGEYTLDHIDDNEDRQSLKLIQLQTEDGQINLSWEKDSQAPYDVDCQPFTDYDSINTSLLLYTTGRADGTDIACYKANIRFMDHSLQIRKRVDEHGSRLPHFDLIARPMRGQPNANEHSSKDRSSSTGEVNVGAVVYKDSKVSVTFLGMDQAGKAKIQITRS